MTEWVKLVDGVPTGTVEADVKPEDIPHKNCVWLRLEVVDPGAHDPATQVKERVDTQHADRYTVAFTVRDKTAQELDRDRDINLDAVDRVVLRVLFNHENRLRALEGRAPATPAEFRAAIKALT